MLADDPISTRVRAALVRFSSYKKKKIVKRQGPAGPYEFKASLVSSRPASQRHTAGPCFKKPKGEKPGS